MKNLLKLSVIIVLVAIIGFTMAACSDGGGGNGGSDGDGKTALQFFTDNNIKAGWNLGNTLDAVEFNGDVPTKAEE